MTIDLSIGIPTAGRPEALRRCIASIRDTVTVPYRIVVFDSVPMPETAVICGDQPDILYRTVDAPVGPAGSRRAIADLDDREVLVYLDDDIIVRKGSIEALLDRLDASPTTDIVAGGWEENGNLDSRALAQWLELGETATGKAIIKRFMTVSEARELGLTSIRADGVLATMAVRRRVWDKVGFDPQYGFFYEMFDLFLQCREQGIVLEAVPGSIFTHAPMAYAAKTTRQASTREADEQRFIAKWGVHPVGKLGLGLSHKKAVAGQTPAPTPSAEASSGSRFGRLRLPGGR